MSSLAYSTFDKECDTTNVKNCRKRNRTYKKKPKQSSDKAEHFLNSMNNDPSITGVPEIHTEEAEEGFPGMEDYVQEGDPSREKFGLLKEGLDQQKKYLAEQQQYYNQYVPSYTGTAQNVPYYSQLLNSSNLQGTSQDELMKKLNYVVHLLEEQHDEKTGSVTEELVLYMFLGVFVIFIVDSFSKSGKYKR